LLLLAGPKRDEQLANFCETIENMGPAGWPILGYCFSVAGGRGNAGLKSFDYDLVKDASEHEAGPVSIDEMSVARERSSTSTSATCAASFPSSTRFSSTRATWISFPQGRKRPVPLQPDWRTLLTRIDVTEDHGIC